MKPVERINFAIVAVTAALFLGISAFVAFSTSKMMENEARSTVENVVKATVGRIDRLMASVESAVENSAWIVGERLSDPDYMFKITGELVQNNSFIVGSTIAFEPNFFPSKGYYYSAFSYKDGTGAIKRIQQGGETFKYHGMDWYRIPKESKKSSWCEPYFDEGGAEVMMCTYSVPLMKRDGTVYAVLTADVSLDDLTHHVAGIKPYSDSYAVLFSQEGKPLVAAPDDAATATDTVKIAGKASNGWTVELVCPLANILQGARSLVWRIVVFSVVGLGLIFFVSWSFSTRLQRATVANERLSSELGIARTIQSSVLKRKVPPYLGTILRPAREVGGDFYDFQEKDGLLYFAVGDASGKSIPAALFTFLAGAGFRDSRPHQRASLQGQRHLHVRDAVRRPARAGHREAGILQRGASTARRHQAGRHVRAAAGEAQHRRGRDGRVCLRDGDGDVRAGHAASRIHRRRHGGRAERPRAVRRRQAAGVHVRAREGKAVRHGRQPDQGA